MRPCLNVAVCEDQKEDMDRLVRLIGETWEGDGPPPAIQGFTSGEELLKAFVPGMFDVIFLDMYLGGASGMETARALRKADGACQIVFITFSEEFALESYQVSAAHYLVKPVSRRDLQEVWARCRRRLGRPEAHITLLVDRKGRDIPLSDILYVEADNKICRVHTRGETLVTRIPIDQLALMLSRAPFYRCHRSYIVNFEHVERAEEDFVMCGGGIVYIRKSEQARIRKMYFQHLIGALRSPQAEGYQGEEGEEGAEGAEG